jgi:glycosyltransferase involved in cell wall biosynthesis
MRILFCNKYNYPFSGTEAYIFDVMDLLRSKGHEAALFAMADPRGGATSYDHHFLPHIDFKNPDGWFQQLQFAGHAIYSRAARQKIRAMIAEFRPDVAHVRNVYHHLSPSILWELKAHKIPIVYHLNDFKALCPSYNLVSHGKACEACKGGSFWHALTEECYPGTASRIELVAEAYFHRILGTYRKCIDCFLAPSQFVRDKFAEHGWDARKFEVLPHFQPVYEAAERNPELAPILYFGRLSREKGVDDLLRAMKPLPNLRLTIAGDGPERPALEQLSVELGLQNVEFAGQLRGPELERAIANSRFTVLPSHAYETLGKTILESYAWGRTVVASDMGSRRELVHAGKTGLLYKTGDVAELTSALWFLSFHPEIADNMGRAGQELVREHHTPEGHYRVLLGLYERLRDTRNDSPSKKKTGDAMQPKTIASPIPISSDRFKDNVFVPLQLLTRPHLTPAPETPRLTRIGEVIHAPMPFPNRKLRVAFIGGRGLISKYSGIETYYEEVGRRLAAMGHEVTVYCRKYFTPPLAEQNGMRILRLSTVRSKHFETLIHTFLSTMHVLTQPCDVVHYHALGPALLSFIPRLAGKRTVVTVQGLDWQRKKWGRIAAFVLRLGERAAVTLPTSTMVVSRTLREYYSQKYKTGTFYVPNGGLMREPRLPEKLLNWGLEPENYILFLGRFSPEKGCHLLIEAYEKLDTNVKLVLAGASSYCDEYSRQLRTHASDRVKFLDAVSGDDLDELLTNAMLFVLPSDLEGLSLALLDAMGAGLCVVASDIPENREAIEDAGFTFRRGDPIDLADRLQFLIANPAVREAAGNAARQRVRETYQWSKVAAEVERVYFETMGWRVNEAPAKKPAASVALTTGAQRKVG